MPDPVMVSCMFAGTVIAVALLALSACPFNSSVIPRTTFDGVMVMLSVVSVSNVTVLFFIDVCPIASCTLI